MAGPWITNAKLRILFADAIKVEHTALPERYIEIVSDANTAAAADITSALTGRGYTSSQIDEWDRRVEFNKHLGLFWCFISGNVSSTYSDVMINKLDRRKELQTVQITIGGEIATPGASTSDPDGEINGGAVVSGGQFLQDQWRFDQNKVF